MVPIITVNSRFYFGIRNCRHVVTNRTLTHNRIVKAVTLPNVYLNLLLLREFPQRHAKLYFFLSSPLKTCFNSL
jgi:hypothetical protein